MAQLLFKGEAIVEVKVKAVLRIRVVGQIKATVTDLPISLLQFGIGFSRTDGLKEVVTLSFS